MHILKEPNEVLAFIENFPDPFITTLIQQRLSDLLQDDDSSMEQLTMEELVFFVVLDPGETIPQLMEALGTDLLTVDGCPLWEFIEEHPTCYEFVIVMSDSGFGSEVFIPRAGIDSDLLVLCQLHATPAQEGIHP
jgi:hypothetical protein